MKQPQNNTSASTAHPRDWKYPSPDTPGLHTVVSPDNSACRVTWAFRLNLNRGDEYELFDKELELNAALVDGEVDIEHHSENSTLKKLDSVYLPAGDSVRIRAVRDAVFFIGGGHYDGTGEYFLRRFDAEMPLGEIHQIHGEPPYEREVFMTLNQEVPASRMINGFTWGASGMWTSWPPHQHTEDLEEVYCYFDLPTPRFALHLSSRTPGIIEAVHPVSTGDFVIIPEGYHPTVGAPGGRSSYFWIMVAHRKKSRSYELAKADFGV